MVTFSMGIKSKSLGIITNIFTGNDELYMCLLKSEKLETLFSWIESPFPNWSTGGGKRVDSTSSLSVSIVIPKDF